MAHDDAIELFNQELTFSLDLDDWIAIENALFGLANNEQSSIRNGATKDRIHKIITAITKGYKVTVTVIPF